MKMLPGHKSSYSSHRSEKNNKGVGKDRMEVVEERAPHGVQASHSRLAGSRRTQLDR